MGYCHEYINIIFYMLSDREETDVLRMRGWSMKYP